MTESRAEEIALLAMGWLAGNDALLPVFMGASGASLDDLRKGASDPAFLGSVLDFLMMDDAWVIACCDSLSLPYETMLQARQGLPGGNLPSWT
ncbi:DUF3572 domain-containing protein [Nioella nitratireducens]|uniref:DUF3572 domain-containing protein n=1 Tax=Nioella nitratireducens TaxID=1287720 RepID=UPI0008FD48AE|nr:DUF3572 domain-containing protein [Nioella nitratireducens]